MSELSLLERGDLPIELLVDFAVREGRRPRPLYQMHKWFARRLPSVFRASLIAAHNHCDTPWSQLYYQPPSLAGKTILDPFVGGGTSVVEAFRLGADVRGHDIDPVACFVTQQELKAAQIPELRDSLDFLMQAVGDDLKGYYSIGSPKGKDYVALHYVWVQEINCSACQRQLQAHHDYILAEGEVNWLVCPTCSAVFSSEAPLTTTIECSQCQSSFEPRRGSLSHGKVTCDCGEVTNLIDYGRSTRKRPTWQLCAIEAFPAGAKRHPVPNRERVFFAPTDADRQSFSRARRHLRRLLRDSPDLVPKDDIPKLGESKDSRLWNYGYRKWSDLFNERQLLHLCLLAKAIAQLPEPLREMHALAFSNHLTTNCMFTSYAPKWRRLTPLFSVRAFRHINRPIEINPWIQNTGRGTYPNAVRQIERGRAFAENPKEPSVGGGFIDVVDLTQGKAVVLNQDSTKITSLKSSSVDFVLSDPPYFDNVVYSELSEFFAVWLRMMGVIGSGSTHRQVKADSLVSKSRSIEGASAFVKGLSEAMSEVSRVLKPSGLFAFTYRHSLPDGWIALERALRDVGLTAVQVIPVPGEIGSGLHTKPNTNLWDAMIVLRPLSGKPKGRTRSIGSQQLMLIREHADEWATRLSAESRVPFSPESRLNLLRACVVAASLGFKSTHEVNGTEAELLLRSEV